VCPPPRPRTLTHPAKAHRAGWPLARGGAVAAAFWLVSCCWGDDALARWFGFAPSPSAEGRAPPGAAPDRPTADLLANLERA